MEITTMAIKDLNRAAYNPRVDLQPGDEEYETIKKSILNYGLVQPIIWNKRTKTIVSGHQRLTVLEDMGETEAMVSVVDLDEIAEKQLNIIMNKVSGEWDNEKLTQVLNDLGDEAADTGFTMPEVEVLSQELETFFDDHAEEELNELLDDQDSGTFILTISFFKDDEKDLKTYIKKNGEEGLVQTIIDFIKEEMGQGSEII